MNTKDTTFIGAIAIMALLLIFQSIQIGKLGDRIEKPVEARRGEITQSQSVIFGKEDEVEKLKREAMAQGRGYFHVGEVAKLANRTPDTIRRWIDRDRLVGVDKDVVPYRIPFNYYLDL